MFHVQSAFKCSFTDVYFNFFMSHNVLVDSVRCQYYLLSAAMLYGLLFTDAVVLWVITATNPITSDTLQGGDIQLLSK